MGFLPGLGPGLAGALWLSGMGSLSLFSANLVFSLGFVLLEEKVRSFPAAWVVFESAPPLAFVFLLLAASVVLAWGAWPLLARFPTFPVPYWVAFQWMGLFFFGGFFTLGISLLALSWRRVIDFYHLPPSLGAWVLVLPIVWFYA